MVRRENPQVVLLPSSQREDFLVRLAASLYCSAGGLCVTTVSPFTVRDHSVTGVKLASFLAPARNVYT